MRQKAWYLFTSSPLLLLGRVINTLSYLTCWSREALEGNEWPAGVMPAFKDSGD